MNWFEMKLAVMQFTGLHMDALHVHAGVLGQVAAALVLRRSLASFWPWLLLLAAVLGNEAYDLAYEIWPNRDDQYLESFTDTWNTMLLPTLLLLACRFLPRLFVRPVPPPAAAAPDEAA